MSIRINQEDKIMSYLEQSLIIPKQIPSVVDVDQAIQLYERLYGHIEKDAFITLTKPIIFDKEKLLFERDQFLRWSIRGCDDTCRWAPTLQKELNNAEIMYGIWLEATTLNVDQALSLITKRGFKISKIDIFKLICRLALPCKEIGGKFVFNKTKLTDWCKYKAAREINELRSDEDNKVFEENFFKQFQY